MHSIRLPLYHILRLHTIKIIFFLTKHLTIIEHQGSLRKLTSYLRFFLKDWKSSSTAAFRFGFLFWSMISTSNILFLTGVVTVSTSDNSSSVGRDIINEIMKKIIIVGFTKIKKEHVKSDLIYQIIFICLNIEV